MRPRKILAVVSLDFITLFGQTARFFHDPEKYQFRVLVQTRSALEQARQWNPDGCIFLSRKPSSHWLAYVARHKIPCTVLGDPPPARAPRNIRYVNMDNREIGAKAAVFLHLSGFGHFAFAGNTANYSVRRQEGFVETLRSRGIKSVACRVDDRLFPKTPFDIHTIQKWPPFLKWLREFPKPTALFAVSDFITLEIASLCAAHSIHVPRDIALLGVGNFEPLCEAGTPRLSSVSSQYDKLVLGACELLVAQLAGKPVAPANFVKCCGEVIARESTDLFTTASPHILRALHAAASDSRSELNVSELAKKVGINRSSLSRLLAGELQLSPLELIHWRKSLRAAERLTKTQWPMEKVAEHAGFSSATRMGIVFKKTMGLTPTAYRRSHSGN